MRLPSARGLHQTLPSRPFRQPWIVLVPLALLQWVLLLRLARSVKHNGWLYYNDGGETFVHSTAWSLAHGHIPPAAIGYGWPLLTAPIAGIAGTNVLSALPALVLLQTFVLLPIALLCMYGIGSRIGGRAIGYIAAVGWVVLPHLADRLFIVGFHGTYFEQFLPQALGLTVTTAFPSTVCVLVAAYFAVTSIDSRETPHAVLAGVFAGFAVAIDPANALFLLAPAAGYAVARVWRPALAFGLAALPATATLLLWKHRGLGHVPHVDADVDFHRLELIRLDLRTYFYSDRLIEIPFLAGVIAIARRSWAKSALVAVWFLAYVLVRGSSELANVPTGSVFLLLMPVFPAFVLACAALPLLVPRLADRLPVAAFLAYARATGAPASRLPSWPSRRSSSLPRFRLRRRRSSCSTRTGTRLLRWTKAFGRALRRAAQASRSRGRRRIRTRTSTTNVYRSRADGSSRLRCATGGGAANCVLRMKHVSSAKERSYTETPPAGRWTYRVAGAANSVDEPTGDDVLLVSPPVDVTVP
jgi:hypothetical protein